MYHFGRSILVAISFLAFLISVHVCAAPANAQGADPKAAAGQDSAIKAGHWAYRKISIGMKADEARKTLGDPKDKSEEQDLYLFTDDELAQVFYDANHSITAISITYYKDLVPKAPTPKDVLGEDAPTKPDGSIFKTVRFPKAGYSVSYSRTAGDSPSVSITFQKI